MKRAFLTLALCCFIGGLWWAAYPDQYDRKNPHYVLWKYHLASMNLDRASSIIVNDPDRNPMILGKTKTDLTKRFGYLKAPSDVRQYLHDYCWSTRSGSDAMFLRNTDLMVIFTNGQASEIVYCKG